MYKLYTKQHVRECFYGEGDYEDALYHLREVKYALVRKDGIKYTSVEELENAKNLKSKYRDEYNYSFGSLGEVPESSDRQVSGTDTDNSE